jgi:5-methylcytosine-specific restriction enzyme subunit McrC
VPDGKGHRFKDVVRDEREMARVFEAFVRNFYRLEQTRYRVEPLTIPWYATELTTGPDDRLPQMRVDVFLRSPDRQLIIDTKYYAETLQTYHDTTSFRSGNLYQLFSYLKNHAPRVPTGTQLDGMLLFPQVDVNLNASYVMQGHQIQIATIDLNMPWEIVANRRE